MAKRLYRFGAFSLDLDRRLLARAGEPVGVSPRGFDILQVLVEQRAQVMSRAEIMAQVWPGVSVEEHNLSVQMSKLRRVLGDSGEDGQVIATVPGRGYRFVAALEEPDSGAGAAMPPGVPPPAPWAEAQTAGPLPAAGQPLPAMPSLPASPLPASPPPAAPPFVAPLSAARGARLPRWWLAAGAAASLAGLAGWAVLPGRRPAPPLSIVVMPLRDLSGSADQTYLADAISDDLTTDLAQIPAATVIARETADSYARRGLPAGELGRALGVRYVLEGSVRKEGAVLHVNAQLIDTGSGAHLWAQRFDVAPDGVSEARDTIVRRIGSALNVELVAVESARSLQDRPRDPTALDLFFRARSILDHDDSLRGFQAAQALLEQSVAAQPGFGDALAELGSLLLRKMLSADDPDSEKDFAEAASVIARAQAVSPRNAQAEAARARMLVIQGKYTEAAYAAREALDRDPANLVALGALALSAFNQGRLDDAGRAMQTLLRINPGSLSERARLFGLGNVRLLQGRVEEAVDLVQRAVAGEGEPRPGSDNWGRAEGAAMLLTAAAAMRGDVAGAHGRYLAYEALWPHRTVWRIASTASRAMAALPGFAAFLGGLRQAGMPEFAAEDADHHVAPSAAALPGESFAATPRTVPGAATISTQDLAAMLRHPDTLLIDLGSGAAVPVGAAWEDEAARTADDVAFIEATVQGAGGWQQRTLVVMSAGAYGSGSYNAVLRLASAGRKVLWYRGGEEAWAKAGLPAVDRRA